MKNEATFYRLIQDAAITFNLWLNPPEGHGLPVLTFTNPQTGESKSAAILCMKVSPDFLEKVASPVVGDMYHLQPDVDFTTETRPYFFAKCKKCGRKFGLLGDMTKVTFKKNRFAVVCTSCRKKRLIRVQSQGQRNSGKALR